MRVVDGYVDWDLVGVWGAPGCAPGLVSMAGGGGGGPELPDGGGPAAAAAAAAAATVASLLCTTVVKYRSENVEIRKTSLIRIIKSVLFDRKEFGYGTYHTVE